MKILLVCILVYLSICCVGALYLHYRGQARLRLGRQLTEHSGLLSPINGLFYAFSSVGRGPILSLEAFPEMAPVAENWESIRDEARALLEGGHITSSERHNDMAFVAFYRRGWQRFYLKWYHDWLPSARELCPRTVALLDQIPTLNAAAFTLLPPGGKLGKHRDPFALSVRYHLGLITPNSEDCSIWVDGNKHSWRDGQPFMFDEHYVHWAHNDTDQTRVIFFADVRRPLRTRFMRWFGRCFSRYVLSMTRSNNVEAEQIGLLNHVTPVLFRVKNFFIAAKEWNRRVYYGVKTLLMVGAGVLVVRWLVL